MSEIPQIHLKEIEVPEILEIPAPIVVPPPININQGFPVIDMPCAETREKEKEMKVTRRQLRKIIAEALDLDIEVGDVILTGRFKNKRTVVKKISTDDLGQPTINGMKALNFRIEKLMPKSKWSKKTLEELEAEKEDK